MWTLFSPLLLNHTRHPRRDRETSHLYYKHISCFGTNTTLSCHITSGHVRQSNPIKFISIFWGKNHQAFHAVSSVCAGSLSWSQSVRVSASAERKRGSSWKEVFRRVLFVSEVYPEGWKFVRRIKKYEKKWDSTLHAKQLAPDTRICMHASTFVWPVSEI